MRLFIQHTVDVNLNINLKHSQGDQLLELVKTIIQQNTKAMGKLEDLLAKQDLIDAATDAIKADLDFIKGQLSQNPDGLTAEQVATLEARIDQSLAKLNALDSETDSNPPA